MNIQILHCHDNNCGGAATGHALGFARVCACVCLKTTFYLAIAFQSGDFARYQKYYDVCTCYIYTYLAIIYICICLNMS